MRTCIGLGGKSYILEDSQFQGGGEASLYQIVDRPNLAAKLYNSRISEDPVQIRERERKLKAMVATNIPAYMDGLLRLAWPMDVLYENGKMVGFVMPKVSCPLNFYDVQRFNRSAPNSLSTKNVLAVWPDFNWKSSLQVAYNLAALVAFLHAKGIVIGAGAGRETLKVHATLPGHRGFWTASSKSRGTCRPGCSWRANPSRGLPCRSWRNSRQRRRLDEDR